MLDGTKWNINIRLNFPFIMLHTMITLRKGVFNVLGFLLLKNKNVIKINYDKLLKIMPPTTRRNNEMGWFLFLLCHESWIIFIHLTYLFAKL